MPANRSSLPPVSSFSESDLRVMRNRVMRLDSVIDQMERERIADGRLPAGGYPEWIRNKRATMIREFGPQAEDDRVRLRLEKAHGLEFNARGEIVR